jgi:DNA polymerase IV
VVSDLAVELLREYAPARPLRLLGVRVAAFADEAPTDTAAADQLALPV